MNNENEASNIFSFVKDREDLRRFLLEKSSLKFSVVKAQLPIISPNLITCLLENERELLTINDRLFEELVARLLKADGYEEIKLIERINASGPDIIAICNHRSGGKEKLIVECKRWEKTVGIEIVRELMYRVDTEYRATYGLIAVTSRFTNKAIEEWQRYHQWRLALKDGVEIINWIRKHSTEIASNEICWNATDFAQNKSTLDNICYFLEPSSRLLYVGICKSRCHRCNTVLICGQSIFEYSRDVYDVYFDFCPNCLTASCHQEVPLLRYGEYCQCEICGYINPDNRYILK